MADAWQQNYSNHTRFDPPFHFFILPVFAITLIVVIVHLFMQPGLHAAWMVVFMIAAVLALLEMRMYALKVQDRVIRLEERLRLMNLLDPALRGRIGEITEAQLIALRFASDAEVPALATRALNEKLPKAEIKKAIQQWRGDYWRV